MDVEISVHRKVYQRSTVITLRRMRNGETGRELKEKSPSCPRSACVVRPLSFYLTIDERTVIEAVVGKFQWVFTVLP
jgi:hypothetical protein